MINEILADSTPDLHGAMLVVHIFRRRGSVVAIHKLLNTHFFACCRDFNCLLPFKQKIEEEVVRF